VSQFLCFPLLFAPFSRRHPFTRPSCVLASPGLPFKAFPLCYHLCRPSSHPLRSTSPLTVLFPLFHPATPVLAPSPTSLELLQACCAVAIRFKLIGGVGYLVKLIHVVVFSVSFSCLFPSFALLPLLHVPTVANFLSTYISQSKTSLSVANKDPDVVHFEKRRREGRQPVCCRLSHFPVSV
jgi:hypothetical protein